MAIAPDPALERLAYSPQEVADAVGCSRQHVQNQIRTGQLRSIKFGRKRLVPRHVLEELLEGGGDG